ncbi:hypothetical protein SAMN05660330_00005 [Desulforhopalus singaporensis]|uniref:Uncharacterized protein n=1 Tax=Desulforhopalus singaporensis TaxID=91360 RepID=A0A1H0ISP7_9BACT|nr:hypothetical protein SAMN05660330_00005 [Desulforhopalus singaporensis]
MVMMSSFVRKMRKVWLIWLAEVAAEKPDDKEAGYELLEYL